MSDGYIKLHRQINKSGVFSDDSAFKLWIYLLTKCQWQDVGIFKAGDVYISQEDMAEDLFWSRPKTSRELNKLVCFKMITLETRKSGNNRGTTVTIINWKKYQDSETIITKVMPTGVTTAVTTADTTTVTTGVTTAVTQLKNYKNTIYREILGIKFYESEFDELNSYWNKQQIDEKLDAIESHYINNDKKLKEIKFTLRSWLYKEYPNGNNRQRFNGIM